ncbi:MAG: 4-hydroxy-2-oxovalerate aldolase [Deltaproteobacteria bacterium]|nr:4-hydroxy-2-oxovalerate aldolase [Deltaproteobacteria bacterium]
MISSRLDILETTLRDGNYVVDFQFTARDAGWLAGRLEACGMNYIEIGHGLGIGASEAYAPAAASDAEYIVAAKAAVSRAKIGMFAIPGIVKLDDLSAVADLGLDFLRVGADLERIDSMAPFIDRARKLGMFVCTNFMKSYTLPADEFAQCCLRAEEFGTQMNYVVDSAGGMLPHEVRRYFEAVADATSVPFGFHGHDNIKLAIANALVAMECGARLIDSTLFGVGRGSGNTATEIIVALGKREYGIWSDKDELELIRLAESEAAPLLRHRHQELISGSLGLAKVHSMYIDEILAWASSHKLDPHALIAEVGAIDRTRVDEAILKRASLNTPGEKTAQATPEGLLTLPDVSDAPEAVRAAEVLAAKRGVTCTLWIVGGGGDGQVEIVDDVDRVDVHISGNARLAIEAATRDATRIRVLSGRGEEISAVRSWTSLPVESADELPT